MLLRSSLVVFVVIVGYFYVTDGSEEQQNIRSKRAKKARSPGAPVVVPEPDQRLDNEQSEDASSPVIPTGFLSPSVKEYLELGKSIPEKMKMLVGKKYKLFGFDPGMMSTRIGEISDGLIGPQDCLVEGRPGTDYPILASVPYTNFYCDEQLYPGFFADMETRCQGWHYCDIDGRQATFLCPNGTQFSQAVFVCDWWFNVRCDLSPRLYAINARLYQRPKVNPTQPHRIITKELVEDIFNK